jgi:hypothetical protein
MSSCAPGHYAVLSPLDGHSIDDCIPCPRNTYTSTNMTIFIPQLPASEQCTPCPFGTRTLLTAASSIRHCECLGAQVLLNDTTRACGSCPADHYYDPGSSACHPCPLGTISPQGSLHLTSCMCPPGSMLSRDAVCQPCPLGYFSSSLGRGCISCGARMTTLHVGATSRLQCRLLP